MKEHTAQKVEQMRERVLQERKEVDSITEGRCQAYAIQSEKKCFKRMEE